MDTDKDPWPRQHRTVGGHPMVDGLDGQSVVDGYRIADGVDGDRPVDLVDDDVVLPGQTSDDTDRGWGEQGTSNDERLLDERPPHWD